MTRQKILLLNPPGQDLYMRDYYCSKTSKARYYYHPVDLLFLSGRLTDDHDIAVLDAIVDRVSPDDTIARVRVAGYDTVVFVTGTVSWEDDRSFLARLKQETGVRLVGSGDLLLEKRENILQRYEWLDAILLDFATPDVLTYLADPSGAAGAIENVVYRGASGEIHVGERIDARKEFRIARPRHELFPLSKYRFPFARRYPIATILSDFGCAYTCDFCQMGSINFRWRPVPDVLEELAYLKTLGVRELFWRDQTFGANRKRSMELLQGMLDLDLDMSWTCFSRCDVMDADHMALMKKAGCHTIIFGVESANQETLDVHKQGLSADDIRETFHTARGLGLRTAGTFIIGLPEDTEDSVLATIDFAKEIDCDFASFNMATPRMATEFRQDAVDSGWVDPEIESMESAASHPVLHTDKLTAADIWRLRNQAVRSFYLRPSYLVRRVLGIRTWHDVRLLLSEGIPLIRRTLGFGRIHNVGLQIDE